MKAKIYIRDLFRASHIIAIAALSMQLIVAAINTLWRELILSALTIRTFSTFSPWLGYDRFSADFHFPGYPWAWYVYASWAILSCQYDALFYLWAYSQRKAWRSLGTSWRSRSGLLWSLWMAAPDKYAMRHWQPNRWAGGRRSELNCWRGSQTSASMNRSGAYRRLKRYRLRNERVPAYYAAGILSS